MLEVKKIFAFILFVCGMACFSACYDKGKEDFSDIPGVLNETWPNVVECNPHGEVLVYTFEALNDWSVVSSDGWCEVFPAFGYKGKSNLKIVVDRNETESKRTATIIIKTEKYKDVIIFLEQEIETIEIKPESELSINLIIDDYLESYYLWNGDYKKLSKDLTIPFVDVYDNYLRTTLMGMTTNTLDKKKRIIDYDGYGNPVYGYSLYSYVERISKSRVEHTQFSGVDHGIEKSGKIRSYGFSRIAVVEVVNEEGYSTGEYEFAVQAIYPNSSASMFGVGRGVVIKQIDGKAVTKANYASLYLTLLNPTKSNIHLLVKYPDKISEVTLTSTMLDPTPILFNKVFEEEGSRIGYLVYDAFDAAYDNELLEVLADFKSKGVTELILDLRYNGGGHVISANMLAACLIGEDCKGHIFKYYRYNASRMADINGTQQSTGNTYDESVGLFGEKYKYNDYFGVNLASYSLNLKRLYVLTTESTASASETLINSMRGHGIPVIVIGEKTNGKNVGMEVWTFDYEGHTYELAPITFQGYNEKKETVPSDGFPVDYAIADWNNGFWDFGNLNEPMLGKAYELITGTSRTRVVSSTSRLKKNEHIICLPAAYKRPEGMIVLMK